MISLYIDTSATLSIGLLNENFNWIKYSTTLESKSSGVIHHLINELLLECGRSIVDVSKIFLANGPGSYTGVRVGEGIGQVFEWQEIETISFHHFHVPFLSGIDKGMFICSAFKGEFLIYTWENLNVQQKLISEHDLINLKISSEHIYSNINAEALPLNNKIYFTNDMIEQFPAQIFKKLSDSKLRVEPFYFRNLNEEFKREKKDK